MAKGEIKINVVCESGVLTITKCGHQVCYSDYSLKIDRDYVTVIGEPENIVISKDQVDDWDAVLADLKTCNNNQLELPETEKFGLTTIQACNPVTGNICDIIACLEDGVWTYSDPFGATYDQTSFTQRFVKVTNSIDFVDTCYYMDNTDETIPEKSRDLIIVDRYLDKNNNWIYVETGDSVNDPANHISNIENYTKMSNVVGLPPELKKSITPEISFEICGELIGTFQDLLDAAIANAGFVLPDGTAPNGILEIEIDAEYKGQLCAGTVTTAQGATIGDPAAPQASLDGGQSWCQKAPYVDADCDGFAGLCYDLTTPITIPAGAGIIVKLTGAACDLDDTDQAVTV